MKEAFIEAHDELVSERMAEWEAAHPNATDEEYRRAEARIYDQTADGAYDRMTDKFAAMADHYRQMKKDGML